MPHKVLKRKNRTGKIFNEYEKKVNRLIALIDKKEMEKRKLTDKLIELETNTLGRLWSF